MCVELVHINYLRVACSDCETIYIWDLNILNNQCFISTGPCILTKMVTWLMNFTNNELSGKGEVGEELLCASAVII